MNPGRALIHGTGLIGASIGLALRRAGWQVTGWDPDDQALGQAVSLGAVGRPSAGPDAALDEVDLIFLAGPPSAIAATVASIETPALVTDVASVKMGIVASAGDIRFVGGHPMAGAATSGPGESSPDLFRNATWVLVTDRAGLRDLEAIEAVVATFGARPLRMSASQHDAAVARISHLPQVLAAALMLAAAAHPDALDLAAGAFRDMTRVASSHPSWWPEVLEANREEVLAALDGLDERLDRWRRALAAGDTAALGEMLGQASGSRGDLDDGRSGLSDDK